MTINALIYIKQGRCLHKTKLLKDLSWVKTYFYRQNIKTLQTFDFKNLLKWLISSIIFLLSTFQALHGWNAVFFHLATHHWFISWYVAAVWWFHGLIVTEMGFLFWASFSFLFLPAAFFQSSWFSAGRQQLAETSNTHTVSGRCPGS